MFIILFFAGFPSFIINPLCLFVLLRHNHDLIVFAGGGRLRWNSAFDSKTKLFSSENIAKGEKVTVIIMFSLARKRGNFHLLLTKEPPAAEVTNKNNIVFQADKNCRFKWFRTKDKKEFEEIEGTILASGMWHKITK